MCYKNESFFYVLNQCMLLIVIEMDDDFVFDNCENLSAAVNAQLEQLQTRVESGVWKNSPVVWKEIFNEYQNLVLLGADDSDFGTVEFWLQVDDVSDLNWYFADEDTPQQEGGSSKLLYICV